MKRNLKFERGEFITQNSYPETFAIFGGVPYEPVEEGDEIDYSLICYYNPSHYEQDSNGKWLKQEIFEYDLEDNDHDETCEYTINLSDMDYWRPCTEAEIDEALKFLATKRLGWLEDSKKFRKLASNEQIKFNDPKSTGVTGGNVNRTSPMYNGNTPGIVNPNARGSAINNNTRKQITRFVDENWEQKEPISTMDNEHKVLVLEMCDKLKYAFSSYDYDRVVIYPTNGSQVPRRAYGYPDAMGYGMCAYNALMQGDDWGYYDCE